MNRRTEMLNLISAGYQHNKRDKADIVLWLKDNDEDGFFNWTCAQHCLCTKSVKGFRQHGRPM